MFGAWSETAVEYPVKEGFSRLFQVQVERTPDACAAACGEERISYRELHARAGRLARGLRQFGVGPEVLVGLSARRSLDLLAAILGILEAGAAYLPLDSSHPAARQRQIVAESACACVVAASDLAAQVRKSGIKPTIRLEDLLDGAERDGYVEPLPAHLAYVIYTSGSTGAPKGAMVEQRGMLNHLYAKIRDLRIGRDDVVAQTAPLSFDISVWQLLAPLLVGARVEIVKDEVVRDPKLLMEQVERCGITILEIVPSLLQQLVERVEMRRVSAPPLRALGWLIATGEGLPRLLCRRWAQCYEHVRLVNAYGPTECSDDVTHHFLERVPSAEGGYAPIGRPIANTRIYVLDPNLEPAPAGVVGELYVAGDGVGRGYRNNPRQTASAFLPDPLRLEPGWRMYDSGDQGRWLAGGVLEYLGRTDEQVKVRGFRIEAGEIEAVLAQHPEVRQAAVVVHDQIKGEKRLLACVVPWRRPELTVNELRAFLKTRLPEYMIPDLFAFADALPLTSNGKIDRIALQAGNGSGIQPSNAGQTTAIEQCIAAVWQDVLPIESVRPTDDFFESGGDSLLLARVQTKLGARMGRNIPISDLFRYPTPRALARYLSHVAAASTPVAPRTPSEQAIAEIWREVLDVPAIGIHDDLFALGGNSLHAMRILLLLNGSLGVDLPVQLLFDAPTVAELAVHVERALGGAGPAPREMSGPVSTREPFTLAPQQESWWYSEYLTGHYNPNNVNIGFRLGGRLCGSCLDQAVAALERRHETLRTAFAMDENGKGVPVLAPPGACELRVARIDLSGVSPEFLECMLERVVRLAHDRPFDLAHGTLARVSLVRLGHDDHVLLLTMPHLTCDGWSMDVLAADLSRLYNQHMRGLPEHLPELRFQYLDFARWQREWQSGPEASAQLAYWRRQLAAPLSPLLPESVSGNGSDEPCFSIRSRMPVSLAPEALSAARRLTRREQCTLFASVLTALKLALHAHTSQTDIRVATLAGNRSLHGTERLVGLFTNVVCLRSRVDDADRVADLIRAVHLTIGSAAAHQDLPFDTLAAALQAEQGTTRSTLFQVALLWEFVSPDILQFPGIGAHLYPRPEDDSANVLVRNTLELRFELAETPAGVSGTATYDMIRFTAAQIRGLADAIDRTLVLAEEDAAITVGQLCGMLPGSAAAAPKATGIELT